MNTQPIGTNRMCRSEERRLVMAIDPVCGMIVKRDKAAAHRTYKGRTYYF